MKSLRLFIPALFVTALSALLPVQARAEENPARPEPPAAVPAKPDKTELKKELAAMEDAFCAMGKSQGLLAAFKYFAAPDVSFIDTDPRKWRGLPAVVERIGPDVPGESLTWSAYYTDVSDDGTMGFNYGRYEARSPGPGGKVSVHTGWFLTIWKRQPDGSWKYVMDNGAPDRPAPNAAAPAPAKPAGS
jgi:ketosteroid isomerase-like protein